jgi:hypothetical protein
VKSYNYGLPKQEQHRNSVLRTDHVHESNCRHGSVFAQSTANHTDRISYGKPAEIYVYARKRPLLSNEKNLADIITTVNSKHMIIAENKFNLDSTPLLKKVSVLQREMRTNDVRLNVCLVSRWNFNLIMFSGRIHRISIYSK